MAKTIFEEMSGNYRQGVTEQLDAENPHEWIGRLNSSIATCIIEDENTVFSCVI